MKSTGITLQKNQKALQVALAIIFLITSSIETSAAVNGRQRAAPRGPILVQSTEIDGVAAI